MNFDRWDFVTLGRLTGLAVMIGGALLSLWGAMDTEDTYGDRTGADGIIRVFLGATLQYVFYGAVVIVIAEVADRMGWAFGVWNEDADDEEPVPAESDQPA